MNARNIDKKMMEYINLLHSSNDRDRYIGARDQEWSVTKGP